MSEGLLVIDKQTEILSCNTSAVKLLGAKKAVTDQSVLTMNRSEPFRKAVEGVLKGKHMADFIELEDGVRQLIANPVLEDGKVTGAVLLLVDVTEKMQRESLRREFTANLSPRASDAADLDFRLCGDHAGRLCEAGGCQTGGRSDLR